MAFMNFKTLSIKECNIIVQSMFEIRAFLERYSTGRQRIASTTRFHQNNIRTARVPLDSVKEDVISSNRVL